MSKIAVIEHWKNTSLQNIVEEIDGIIYEEQWADIGGYEGLYMVSTFGRIKSLERININFRGVERHLGCFILSQTKLKVGYTKVSLYKNNKWATKAVHRLVAIAFLENPENKPEVNHIFGVKYDNRVLRLEWNTPSENSQHKFDVGLQIPYWIGRYGKDHPSSRPVNQYDKNMKFIRTWESATEAASGIGVKRKTSWISACCRGSLRMVKGRLYESKLAYGYIWKYA